MFTFAGQIFQFFARPGNVDNYGLFHPEAPPKPMEGAKWHFWKFGPHV